MEDEKEGLTFKVLKKKGRSLREQVVENGRGGLSLGNLE